MAILTKTNLGTGETNQISLIDTCNGAIKELVDREFASVMKNILDPNTDPKAKRNISIKITFAPSADRSNMITTLAVSSKLAAVAPIEYALLVGGTESNPQVMETSNEVSGQINFDGEETEEAKVIKLNRA